MIQNRYQTRFVSGKEIAKKYPNNFLWWQPKSNFGKRIGKLSKIWFYQWQNSRDYFSINSNFQVSDDFKISLSLRLLQLWCRYNTFQGFTKGFEMSHMKQFSPKPWQYPNLLSLLKHPNTLKTTITSNISI